MKKCFTVFKNFPTLFKLI